MFICLFFFHISDSNKHWETVPCVFVVQGILGHIESVIELLHPNEILQYVVLKWGSFTLRTFIATAASPSI